MKESSPKTSFMAKQVADRIDSFLKQSEDVPEYVNKVMLVIERSYPELSDDGLTKKLERVGEDLAKLINEQPEEVSAVDYYICMEHVINIDLNISKEIERRVKNMSQMLVSHKPINISDDDFFQAIHCQIYNNYFDELICDKSNIDHIRSILKRFRYRRDIYDLMTKLIPISIVDHIEDDYLFNFDKYRKDFYKYYHLFYIRGESVDPVIASILLHESSTSDFDYEGKPYSLKFNVDFYKPIEHIIEELDEFRNAATMLIVSACGGGRGRSNNQGSLGYRVLKDYLRDSSGRIVNKNNISQLFSRWQRYLDVYDLVKVEGLTLAETKDIINEKYPSAVAKVEQTIDNECSEAIRLINSASKGLFPD